MFDSGEPVGIFAQRPEQTRLVLYLVFYDIFPHLFFEGERGVQLKPEVFFLGVCWSPDS